MSVAAIAISARAARRIALASQGFGAARRDRPPGARRILELIRRLGLLQLDSVNVFVRAHYMPVFSRLGPYDMAQLDRLAGHRPARAERRGRAPAGARPLVEYWAHEASLIPVELHPLLRWRMQGVERYAWGSIRRVAAERPELVASVLDLVARQGPIRAGETDFERPPPRPGHMWNWHEGKRALEYLFFTGQVAAAGRVAFERLYDLPERVLPPAVLSAPDVAPGDAQRELVRVAARALGVATEPDLGDYFRLPRADSKARVAELVASGELLPCTVEGWDAPAYLWSDARRPRHLDARALLSPFDPLVWFRDRAQRLFDFNYRIEIYTPAEKRIYGYYVLPFLLGDRLVARVDLKADRARGVLVVRAAFAESGVPLDEVAPALAEELWLAAGWLGLVEVEIEAGARGELARPLADAVATVALILAVERDN